MAFEVDDHVVYVHRGYKQLETKGTDKINEADYRTSRARIQGIYDAPVTSGHMKKKTEKATKKVPLVHIMNINSGNASMIPKYAILRLMNDKEVDEYVDLSSSTSSSKSSKKRSSDDSDSDQAPPTKKKSFSK